MAEWGRKEYSKAWVGTTTAGPAVLSLTLASMPSNGIRSRLSLPARWGNARNSITGGGRSFVFSPRPQNGAPHVPPLGHELPKPDKASCQRQIPHATLFRPAKHTKIPIRCNHAQIPIKHRNSKPNKTSHFREAAPNPSHSPKIVPRRTISPIAAQRKQANPRA